MFSLKSVRLFRSTVASKSNLNFTRIQELRRIVKSFEPISNVENPEDVATKLPEISKVTEVKNPVRNPFRSLNDSYLSARESIAAEVLKDVEVTNSTDITKPVKSRRESLPSPFDPVDSDNPPDLVVNFPPTFNLAAYVNESETLQQLLKLGVDLSRIEKRKGLPQFILKLDFEKDMKQHLTFLTDVGVPPDKLGEFITKNPLIFKENLGDLEVRVNYLEVKKFKREQIARIVEKNPFWLMFSTKRIDNRLGYFQKNFQLTGDDIRFLATKQPRLITYSMEHIRKSSFCIREEMGFDKDEVKCLLLSKPKLWMMSK